MKAVCRYFIIRGLGRVFDRSMPCAYVYNRDFDVKVQSDYGKDFPVNMPCLW